MDDHPGGLAPLFDDAGKDRTYTDTELQELLSFVENMDNATSADELAGGLNHVGLGLAPANAGLSHPVPHAPVLPMRFNEQGISLQFQPGPTSARGRGRGGRGGGRGAAPAVGNFEAPVPSSHIIRGLPRNARALPFARLPHHLIFVVGLTPTSEGFPFSSARALCLQPNM